MSKIEKVLATGRTHTVAVDRIGVSPNHDDRLNLSLSGTGSVPHKFEAAVPHPTAEQLFAGAWSACYISAIGVVAKEKKLELPRDLAVDIEVDLGLGEGGFLLQARLKVSIPGFSREQAEEIAHAADQICPYSKATRGNIDVTLTVI
jgi:Ohr subfamily peroxiredoxin